MALLAKNNQKKFIATILIVVGLFFAVNFVSPAVVKAQSPGLIDTVGTPASQGLPPPVLATENLTSPPNKDDSNEAGSVSNFVKNLIGSVAAVIVTAEGWAIWALTKVLLFVVQYNGFVTSPAVGIGWTLVRDVANLFFVVVLLAIAIATILRVESYNFKKLLPKLILMAILVNFSKTIAGLMIDFAQVVMMTFVAAFAGVAGDGNIVQALQINSIINYDFSQTHSATLGNLAGTALLMVVMLFITIIVLIVILAVLVIRVVMLWVLVVLSPLAYILAAFPQGQRYANQWWEEFTKYVIIGPVLAFFLWLTFAIASSGELAKDSFEPGHEAAFQELSVIEPGRGLVNTGTTPPAPGDITGIGNEIGRPDKLLSFVIAIAMLMGSLVITQKVGVVGGGIASSAFAGIRKAGAAPFRLGAGAALTLGRAPFQFAARKVNEGIYEGKLPRWVNPAALYRGWNERRSFLHQRAKLGATAGAEEAWEKLFTGVAQPRRLKLQIAEQSQYVSDYKFLPKERLANIAADLARQPRSPENQAKLRAVVQTAFENGYDDDLLDHEYFRQFAPKDSKGRRRHLSKEHYLKAYHHMIGDHEAGLMTLSTGDDIAHRTKHYAVAGLTDTDSKTGEVRMADYDKAAKKFNFDKAEGEAGYTAYAVEGRGLQIKEAIKEAGRARGQWHFQGEVPVIDDEELGMRVAAPFDEITRQMLGMKLKGQQERFVGEHYVTRTAMAEFGGIVGNTVADFEDDDKTMVLPGGDKYPHLLRNIAFVSSLEDWTGKTFFKKLGGSKDIQDNADAFVKFADKKFNLEKLVDVEKKAIHESEQPGLDEAGKKAARDKVWNDFYRDELGLSPAGPGPTPSPAPAGPGPSAPMADIDIARHERTKQARERFSKTTGLPEAEFYNSNQYNPAEYFSQQEFESNEQLVGAWRQEIGRIRPDVDQTSPEAVQTAIREEQSKIRGARSAAGKKAGEQAGVGIDFSDQEVQRIFGVNQTQAGAFYKQEDFTAEQKTHLKDKYADQLQTEVNQGKITEDKALELTDAFDQSLDKVSSLRLTNNAGYASRLETARHERMHPEIEKLSPEEIDKIYDAIDNDKKLEMEAEVKARWTGISEADMKKEILTQGLASYGRSDARGTIQLTDQAAQAMAKTGKVKMTGAAQKQLEKAEEPAVTKEELKTTAKERKAKVKERATKIKAARKAKAAEEEAEAKAAEGEKRQVRRSEAKNAPVYTQANSALGSLSPDKIKQIYTSLSSDQQSALEQEVKKSYADAGRAAPASEYNLQLAALSRALARANLEPGIEDNLHLKADVVAAIKKEGVDVGSVGTQNRLYRKAQQAQNTYQERRDEYNKLERRRTGYVDTLNQKKAENTAEIKRRNEAARTAASRGDNSTAADARKRAEFLQKDNARIDKDLSKFDLDIEKAKKNMQQALDKVIDLETRRRPKEETRQAFKDSAAAKRSGDQAAQQKAEEVFRRAAPDDATNAAKEAVDEEAEKAEEAVKNGNSEEIISALNNLSSIMEGVKTALEGRADNQQQNNALAETGKIIKALSGHVVNKTARLDPGSTEGLLRSINMNLTNLGKTFGNKVGRAPEEPKDIESE